MNFIAHVTGYECIHFSGGAPVFAQCGVQDDANAAAGEYVLVIMLRHYIDADDINCQIFGDITLLAKQFFKSLRSTETKKGRFRGLTVLNVTD